jgi:hypothetical protein
MAKARPVVSDNASGEVDELRRQFNNLLVVIENTATMASLQAAIVAGGETGVELNGVKPGPTHPRRPRVSNDDRVTMDQSSDY